LLNVGSLSLDGDAHYVEPTNFNDVAFCFWREMFEEHRCAQFLA
jgi:hypothetical protein